MLITSFTFLVSAHLGSPRHSSGGCKMAVVVTLAIKSQKKRFSALVGL